MLFCMASSVSAQNFPPADSTLPHSVLYIGADIAPLGITSGTGALALPGISAECGGVLGGGSGTSWRASGLLDIPIGPALALRILPGVAISHSTLSATIPGTRPLRSPSEQAGGIEQGVVDRVVDLDRTDLLLSALLRIPVAGRLHAAAGFGAAYTLSSHQVYRDLVISPASGLFRNGRRDDTIFDGASLFAATPVVPSMILSASYDLPISSSSTISPTLSLSYPILGRTAAGNWRDMAFEFGGTLRFGLTRTPPVDTIIAPVPVPVPALNASILTYPPIVQVRIDEYDSIEALPVLNQVFFAEGSSTIPDRYRLLDRESAAVFTRDQLTGSALDVYYHMLNLIGKRMQEIPGATLALNGHRNSREADARLAASRAESIRKYLVDVWRISARRITVRGGALPPSPARETAEEGFEENARVELIASDPNITKPHFRRHIQRVANPPGVTFYPAVTSEAGVRNWQLDVEQGGEVWRSFTGAGEIPDSIPWDWRGDRRDLPQFPMRLNYRLLVVDSTGQSFETDMADIAVNYRTVGQKMERRVNDTTIEIFSLLLFTYDSPRLSAGDQELIRAIAGQGEGVSTRAVVHFRGYTDSLGDAGYNRQLANTRAAEAARLFRSVAHPSVQIVVHDDGGELERFPYSTPEGRSHDRTVILEIRTPTDGKNGTGEDGS